MQQERRSFESFLDEMAEADYAYFTRELDRLIRDLHERALNELRKRVENRLARNSGSVVGGERQNGEGADASATGEDQRQQG